MSQRLIANVLTQAYLQVAGETVAAMVGKQFRSIGISVSFLKYLKDDKKEYLLEVDGIEIAVLYMGSSMPQEVFQNTDGSARDENGPLVAHRDHAVIANFRDVQGHEATFRAALAVLRVASALSEISEASAVFWVPAETLAAANDFRQVLAPGSEQADVPISILARVVPYKGDAEATQEPTYGLAALGFHHFIGRDIEFAPKPIPLIEIANRYANLGAWLLQRGLVFKDGETCGLSADERIRVRFRDTGRISLNPVIDFEIEHLGLGLADERSAAISPDH